MTPSADGFGFEQDMLTPASTFTLRRVSRCSLDQQLMRNLPDGSGCCDRMGPMVCSKRFAVTGPFSVKIADPILRSYKITGCCKKVGGG